MNFQSFQGLARLKKALQDLSRYGHIKQYPPIDPGGAVAAVLASSCCLRLLIHLGSQRGQTKKCLLGLLSDAVKHYEASCRNWVCSRFNAPTNPKWPDPCKLLKLIMVFAPCPRSEGYSFIKRRQGFERP